MTEAAIAHPPAVRQRTLAKARILLEALPYMREHRGQVVVVKLGGAAMSEPHLTESFAQDVALLWLAGIRVVVVHGGGPQITAVSERLGLTPRFEQGLRVTDAETLEAVRMVLVGRLNKDLVGAVIRQGVPAAGMSGDDGSLLIAAPREESLGYVGEVVEVRPALLDTLLTEFIPIVASTATDGRGQPYNVNADEAAAALAAALGAAKLIYVSDVPGIMAEEDGIPTLLSEVPLEECPRLVAAGVARGGMVPKLQGIERALRSGVERAHIVDGRVEHSLVLELFTPEGLGTMVTREVAG